MGDYKISTAGIKEKTKLYDVLVNSFYPDMPLFQACNVITPPPIDKWPALQDLEKELTLTAVSTDGSIKGVAINVTPNEGIPINGPTILGQFWDYLLQDSKGLITELEKTTMELRILTVSKECRGKGIAKRLILESENLAKRLGFNSIHAIATGAHVENAFKRNNWKCIYTLKYEDYAKINKEFILPESPNDQLTLYQRFL